jgi:hypothetical protein
MTSTSTFRELQKPVSSHSAIYTVINCGIPDIMVFTEALIQGIAVICNRKYSQTGTTRIVQGFASVSGSLIINAEYSTKQLQ